MKLAVIGSRKWPPAMKEFIAGKVVDEINKYWDDPVHYIVSGGADGVDTFAEQIAEKYKLKLKVFYPSSKYEYPVNLFIRNEQIVQYADKILIFMVPGGSPGSMHAFRIAKLMKKPVEIFYCPC